MSGETCCNMAASNCLDFGSSAIFCSCTISLLRCSILFGYQTGTREVWDDSLHPALDICPLASGTRSDEVVSTESRSEEHKSELQSLMRLTYAVFCLHKK